MLALFFEDGMYGMEYILRFGDEEDIRNQLSYRNDWLNVVQCGKEYGPSEDKKNLKKLESFLRRPQSRKTFEKFEIELSTGTVGCIMCADSEKECERIKEHLIENMALEESKKSKLNNLFAQIARSFTDADMYNLVFEKMEERQYATSGIAKDDY